MQFLFSYTVPHLIFRPIEWCLIPTLAGHTTQTQISVMHLKTIVSLGLVVVNGIPWVRGKCCAENGVWSCGLGRLAGQLHAIITLAHDRILCLSGVHTPSLCQRFTVNRKMTPNVASNVDRMLSIINARFLSHKSSASWGPGCYDRLFKHCTWVNWNEDGGASLQSSGPSVFALLTVMMYGLFTNWQQTVTGKTDIILVVACTHILRNTRQAHGQLMASFTRNGSSKCTCNTVWYRHATLNDNTWQQSILQRAKVQLLEPGMNVVVTNW